MRIYLVIFLIAVLSSCSNKAKEVERNDSIPEEVEEMDLSNLNISCPDIYWGDPPNEANVKRWKKRIKEAPHSDYYFKLAGYYSDNPHLQDEMIEYVEIMVKHAYHKDMYKADLYEYVKDCKLPKKRQLMAKAIRYLKSVLKSDDPFSVIAARKSLAELYREGIYIPKDTVIAEYLENKGINLDSIIQTRKGQ